MNKVNLVGRLTKDPEVKYTADQKAVTRFTIAVNRRFKQEGQPDADFLPIVVFGKTAENCGKYISKGRLVSISGRIQTGSWDDKEGKRHFTTDVIADEVHFLDKGSSAPEESTSFYPAPDEEDDLPF